MLTLLVAFAHIVSAEILDHEMTSQERKKTGVCKLSGKEKASLQRWIDTFYEKRTEPVEQEEGLRSMLYENLSSGSYIRLSNDTLWNIYSKDTNIAMGWITAVDIIVSKNTDPDYPYTLTNSLSGSKIRARKAEDLPALGPSVRSP